MKTIDIILSPAGEKQISARGSILNNDTIYLISTGNQPLPFPQKYENLGELYEDISKFMKSREHCLVQIRIDSL